MCHLVPVTCHLSPTPTATAPDPPPANSLTFHKRLVPKDRHFFLGEQAFVAKPKE